MKRILAVFGAALLLTATAHGAGKEFASLQPFNGDDILITLQKQLKLQNSGPTVTVGPNLIATVTPGSASITTTSATVLAANANRKDAVISNNGATPCFLVRGPTATAGQGIYLAANGGTYNIDANNLWRGAISAITSSGTTTISTSEGQ